MSETKSNKGITKPAITRLAERAGVLSLSNLSVDESRSTMILYLRSVLKDAVSATEFRRAKTTSPADVKFALEQKNVNIVYSSPAKK